MNRWEIFLANVPFEDTLQSKIRPVVILDDSAFFVDCLKATSQAPRPNEYVLQKWREAGLKKPTTIRIAKNLHLPKSALIKRIGLLHAVDILELQKRISA